MGGVVVVFSHGYRHGMSLCFLSVRQTARGDNLAQGVFPEHPGNALASA